MTMSSLIEFFDGLTIDTKKPVPVEVIPPVIVVDESISCNYVNRSGVICGKKGKARCNTHTNSKDLKKCVTCNTYTFKKSQRCTKCSQ
jgi:hypothetical protein